MTLYRYSSDSLIDEVRLVTNASGGHRAYLHARSNATPEQLAEINQHLLSSGYKTIPYSEHGKPTLEVRGLKNNQEFVSYLSNHGWVQGAAEITKQRGDSVTLKERLRNATLKGTGFLYNIGDVAYLIYTARELNQDKKALAELVKAGASAEQIAAAKGAVSGSKLGIGGGIGYALGGIVLSFFASKDQSQNEIKTDVKKVRNFMLKEGITIPEGSASHEITKKEEQSTGQKVTSFLRKNPSEVLNTIYTAVGILLASASIKKVAALKVPGKSLFAAENKHAFNEAKDIGLGAVTMSSSLIGLLVKEKKREPDEPKRTGFAGIIQSIREKPLRATGIGLGISTLFHAWSTYGKYKDGDTLVRETVKYRAVFVAANIFAEALLFLSSKGHGEGVKVDDSVEKSVVATTAELISKQNPTIQNQLVDQLAGYMASSDILGGKAETIAAELRAQLAVMHNHPWVRGTKPAKPMSDAAPAPLTINKAPEKPITRVAADSAILSGQAVAPETAQGLGA